MRRFYVPKILVDDNVKPVFDSYDIRYLKYVNNGNILRVMRLDPGRGVASVLYVGETLGQFLGETCCGIDEGTHKVNVERSKIKDAIWLKLLEGVPILDILSKYKPQMLGYYPSGSFEFDNGRTFHIEEIEEKVPSRIY